MGAEGDPLLLAGAAQALLAPPRVGAPVGADVELVGAALARQRQGLWRPDRRGERRGARRPAQRLAEVAQRLEQEGDPVGGGEARPEQRLVEDEERHRALRLRRRRQGRVVAHPQVAVEEDDRGAHFPMVKGWRNARREGTRARANASTAISASCCRSCASPCPASRSSSPSCSPFPFQQNFTKINGFEKDVYFFTLLCTALSAILLDRAVLLPPRHLPPAAEARADPPRQPLHDRRPHLPRPGDDRRDRADHRRALRRRRHRDHRASARSAPSSPSGTCCRCGGGSV